MSQYTLLTGATGLLGSFLMRDLLSSNQQVAVLVRSTKMQTAAERVEAGLVKWESWLGHPIARPVYLEGDVNQPHLGLDSAGRRWVASHCRRMIHNAAVLTFVGQDRQQDPWRTNLGGTHRALQLCQEVGLREFHYVSTAYVCGKRNSHIQEHELEAGQEFRNDYEHSKYLAEKLVRDNEFIDPPTVYRPVVIAGDSKTGMTTSYHGIYVYLRLLNMLLRNVLPDDQGRRHVPLRLALQGDERHNLVPVDWVSEVICDLIKTPAAHGRTFHLAPREPITVRRCYEAACRFFKCYGIKFCGREWQPGSDVTPFEKAFLAHGERYHDYERTDPVFSTANLRRFASHRPSPDIDDLVLQRYFSYGQQQGWGRRSWPLPVISIWAEDMLQRILSSLKSQEWLGFLDQLRVEEVVVGADILGPGGGQWRITVGRLGRPSMAAGLPLGEEPIVRMSASKLAQLLGVTERSDTRLLGGASSESLFSSDARLRPRLLRLLAARLAHDKWVLERRHTSLKNVAS